MEDKAEKIKKDLVKYDGYSEEDAAELVESAKKAAEAAKIK